MKAGVCESGCTLGLVYMREGIHVWFSESHVESYTDFVTLIFSGIMKSQNVSFHSIYFRILQLCMRSYAVLSTQHASIIWLQHPCCSVVKTAHSEIAGPPYMCWKMALNPPLQLAHIKPYMCWKTALNPIETNHLVLLAYRFEFVCNTWGVGTRLKLG